MNLAKGPARLGFVAALMALLLAPMAFSGSTASAQVDLPAQYYGTVEAGQTVTASIGDTECGSSVAGEDGFWHILIGGGEGDCDPVEGDTISFAIDGDAAEQTAAWRSGGLPDDVGNGISLTVAAMEEPEEEEPVMEDPVEEEDAGTMVPGDPDVGNAGLVTQSGTSALAVLALGVLALAGVAGARTVTGRID